jgi:hypothetical protein
VRNAGPNRAGFGWQELCERTLTATRGSEGQAAPTLRSGLRDGAARGVMPILQTKTALSLPASQLLSLDDQKEHVKTLSCCQGDSEERNTFREFRDRS